MFWNEHQNSANFRCEIWSWCFFSFRLTSNIEILAVRSTGYVWQPRKPNSFSTSTVSLFRSCARTRLFWRWNKLQTRFLTSTRSFAGKKSNITCLHIFYDAELHEDNDIKLETRIDPYSSKKNKKIALRPACILCALVGICILISTFDCSFFKSGECRELMLIQFI